jgi:hypothetical protein
MSVNLITNISALASRVGAEFRTLRAQIQSSLALKADAASVYTKTQSDAALALKADASNVYSVAAADMAISTAINNLVAAAPGTLDTLKEIADAIEADQTTAAALAQTVALKANAADVYVKADVYNKLEANQREAALRQELSSANYVTTFENALAGINGGDGGTNELEVPG